MSIQQPTNTNNLNSPNHSLSHRVFANDDSAPVKKVVVDSNGDSFIGDYDGGNYTKIDANGVHSLVGTAKGSLVLRPEMNQDEIRKELKPALLQRGVFFGYSMPIYNNDNEEIFFKQEVPGRWDGVSDITIHITCALTAGEDIGDRFQFQLSWEHDGVAGDILPDTTNDVSVETIVLTDRNEAYDIYEINFTVDYDIDGEGNEITAGEMFGARLRRIAATTSEVDNNIMVLKIDTHYIVNKMFKAS